MVFDDIELVGEATSGREALALCEQLQPDVVLMDIKMPGMDGVATTHAIRKRHGKVQVIALTSFREGELVQEAFQAGAIGYLLKDMDMHELADAIRSAYAGKSILAPAAAQTLVATTTREPEQDWGLTNRQCEVLGLIVEGRSNAQIARELQISQSTVRFHVSEILQKLGVSNRTEATALALKRHLIA
jgi:NarL family two-component system response regulator LiaR